jgi:hypothetical protein
LGHWEKGGAGNISGDLGFSFCFISKGISLIYTQAYIGNLPTYLLHSHMDAHNSIHKLSLVRTRT